MGTDEHGLIEIQSKWWSAQGWWWVRSARGVEVSLLTGVVPKSKGRENEPFGKGYNPTFAGIFTLMRRERRAPEGGKPARVQWLSASWLPRF